MQRVRCLADVFFLLVIYTTGPESVRLFHTYAEGDFFLQVAEELLRCYSNY